MENNIENKVSDNKKFIKNILFYVWVGFIVGIWIGVYLYEEPNIITKILESITILDIDDVVPLPMLCGVILAFFSFVASFLIKPKLQDNKKTLGLSTKIIIWIVGIIVTVVSLFVGLLTGFTM